MRQLNVFALALLSAFALVGCIDIDPGPVYSCRQTSDCPPKYQCDETSRLCVRDGQKLTTPPGADLGGTFDLTPGHDGDTEQCHDGVKDGNESGVDCGGSCEPCATGVTCGGNTDCASQICNMFSHVCVGSDCDDGVKDNGETDTDCGGGTCQSCATGKSCIGDSDCQSNICSTINNTCAGTLCTDGVKDGMETGVDCGGGECPKCMGGSDCSSDNDCLSGACSVATHTCAASACENGQKDPGETDVDCGGPTCDKCALTKACLVGTDCMSGYCNAVTFVCVANQCSDGTKNGSETDVDCGGSCGSDCKVGESCKVAADCASGTCGSGNTCVSSQCLDGVKDGAETDKDCGGGTCPTCPNGDGCSVGTRDCQSTWCNASTKLCVSSQCLDGTLDGSESDVDCGGPTCSKCATGLRCKAGTDCTSSWCSKTSGLCVATQCTDGTKDNGETDVDCGGGAATGCAVCGLGQGCGMADSNCSTGACNFVTSLCVQSACFDGRLDNVETDIDCGGGTCVACPAGKICKVNTDCSSSACDFGPSPHQCVNDQCVDHHKDGNETDVDCGGGTCNACALNLGCSTSSDCQSGYCDPSTKKCECGGVGQACCSGNVCNQTSNNMCNGEVLCVAGNVCQQQAAVTCTPATSVCYNIGTCDPSTGVCSSETPTSGNSCPSADQCYTGTTCSNGTCGGGTHVQPRCSNADSQTCSNNQWTTTTTCTYGCSGNGVCNGPTVAAPTVTINGTDVSISWTVPAGQTCSLLRSDNGGAYRAPLNTTACPSSAPQPCTVYDPSLLRGTYAYELQCSAGSLTGTSPPSATVSPTVEICAGDWSTSLQVHTPWSTNTTDRLERQISTAASLDSTTGVAFAGPSTSTNTNCAPSDHTCGTIFVASYDNDKVMAFDRRANDADASSSGPQPPSNSERLLTLSLKDSGATRYEPEGVAVLGSEVIVAMNSAPGFLAGYSVNFATGTATPNWYLRGKNTASVVMPNKLSAPMSVAVDNGSGTGSGYIFVGNSPATGSTSYTITGYRRDDINTGINSADGINDTVAPFVTITQTFAPYALAVDPVNHVLYATDPTSGRVVMYSSTATGAVTAPTGALQGPQMHVPSGLAFLPGTGGTGTLYVVDNTNGIITSFPAGVTGQVTPTVNFAVSSLSGNATGIAICN